MEKTLKTRAERAACETGLHFPQGILGFEEVQEYTLRRKEQGPVWELRSDTCGYPRFLLFEADSVADDYAPALPKGAAATLGATDPGELSFFAVAVVPDDIAATTVNLRSPIVVNFCTGLAAQVVLENAGYPMRYPVFAREGGRP